MKFCNRIQLAVRFFFQPITNSLKIIHHYSINWTSYVVRREDGESKFGHTFTMIDGFFCYQISTCNQMASYFFSPFVISFIATLYGIVRTGITAEYRLSAVLPQIKQQVFQSKCFSAISSTERRKLFLGGSYALSPPRSSTNLLLQL